MSNPLHSHQAYTAAMRTVSGTRQIVMLYDGILRQLQLARECIESGNIEERYKRLTRASEIIFGLQNCLDYEKGGQMAHILYQFYMGMDLRIFALHRNPLVTECDAVSKEIRQMRDAWDAIDRNESNAEAPSSDHVSNSPIPDSSLGDGITITA